MSIHIDELTKLIRQIPVTNETREIIKKLHEWEYKHKEELQKVTLESLALREDIIDLAARAGVELKRQKG